MAFSKAIPEAFCVTFFNGSRTRIYTQSKRCTITCKTTLCCCCFIVPHVHLQNPANCAALCQFAFCNHLDSCRENTNSFCLHR